MKIIVFIAVLFFSSNCFADKRKVEYFLWLPPSEYVKGDYEAEHCWATKRFLDTKIELLNEICDFEVVDTNIPDNRYFEGKIIKSHSLRIGGVWIGESNAILKSSEEFYKHLRYLILLDKFLIENERINPVGYINYGSASIFIAGELIYGKDTEIEFQILKINPKLDIFPVFRDEIYFNDCQVKFGLYKLMLIREKSSRGRHFVEKNIDRLKRIDYNTGILSSIIQKEEQKLRDFDKPTDELEP